MEFQEPNPNGNGFNIFDNKEIKDNVGGSNQARKQMLKKLVDSGNVNTLQLKVLSSAHLEKDFTLEINAMGVVPQHYNLDSGLSLGNDNGPRRQEYDGFTYFGVEDGTKTEDDEEDSQDGHGATGGYIEDASGM